MNISSVGKVSNAQFNSSSKFGLRQINVSPVNQQFSGIGTLPDEIGFFVGIPLSLAAIGTFAYFGLKGWFKPNAKS